MEWGIAITGMYLMGMVMLAVSSLNSESTPQVEWTQQAQLSDNRESAKTAA